MYIYHPQSAMPSNRRIPVPLQYEITEENDNQNNNSTRQNNQKNSFFHHKEEQEVTIPSPGSKVLLHSCCAPCND